MDSPVGEPDYRSHRRAGFPATLVKVAQRQWLEETRDAGRCRDGVAYPKPAMHARRIGVVHATQPIVRVDLGIDARGRLAHPRRGELPAVTSIERRRIEYQDWHLRGTPPIVVLRREAGWL